MKKILTVIAVLAVVLIIGASAVQYFNANNAGPFSSLGPNRSRGGGEGGEGDGAGGGGDNGAGPGGSDTTAPTTPDQPAWCPAVEFISAPGTWESAADDDPMNPQANPQSFMLTISQPLQQTYTPDEVKVWTLPYTAQFKNINSQSEMSYDESRDEGTSRLEGELRYMGENCPGTKFLLSGFSQGAVIVGDVADRIGGGNGPISADSVLGVALVADGRRENGVGQNPGVELSGVGAEIALEPISGLVQPIVPGATMRGPRPNGFGALASRTYQICAPSDSICDAPRDISNGLDRAMELINANGVHARYAFNQGVIPGVTANSWVEGWARKQIEQNLG